MEILKKIVAYLDIRTMFSKKNVNFNLRMMHGMNRISIFMFFIAVIMLLVKALS